MEEILQEIQNFRGNFEEQKSKIDVAKEELKNLKKDLESKKRELEFTMAGTYDRQTIQQEYDKMKEENERKESEINEIESKMSEEFNSKKKDLISTIDSKMNRYAERRKLQEDIVENEAKIKELEEQKKENENKYNDVQEIINEYTAGIIGGEKKSVEEMEQFGKDLNKFQIHMNTLKIRARNIDKDIKKLEDTNKDLTNRKLAILEESSEELSDLTYLKTRILGLQVENIGQMNQDPFLSKYGKVAEQEPTPVEPTPTEPTPVEPTPTEPTPVEPTPVEPTPINPSTKKIDIKTIKILEGQDKLIVESQDEIAEEKISIIDKNKKELFEKLKIKDICNELTGNRLSSALLRRKINPNVIVALQYSENENSVKQYIKDLRDKKEFKFNLMHDLSGLKPWQKFMKNKFIKAEEKCGATILGKLFDKNATIADIEEFRTKSDNNNKEKTERAEELEEVIKSGKLSRDYKNIHLNDRDNFMNEMKVNIPKEMQMQNIINNARTQADNDKEKTRRLINQDREEIDEGKRVMKEQQEATARDVQEIMEEAGREPGED